MTSSEPSPTKPAHDDDDDDNDNDNDNISSSSDDDDSDTEEEAIDSTPRSDIKQHLLAILIGIIGAIIAFDQTSPKKSTLFSSIVSLKSSTPHYAEYRRTAGLYFCPTPNVTVGKNVETFDFRIPTDLIPTMLNYYEEDEEAEKELFGDATVNKEHTCLLELESTTVKNFIRGMSTAYITPPVESFYQLRPPESYRPGKPILKVPLTFTGFAAKFYNLTPKPLNLYWEGLNGKVRKIGVVKPFQTIGTATTPGQSFYFAPLYDKTMALERFVATVEDASIAYDPIQESKEKGEKPELKLTPEEMHLYNMARLNFAFEKDYIVKTKRNWLSNFPRPPPMHHMWSADYFGHKHLVHTEETHFISLPEPPQLERLTYDDYRDTYQRKLTNHRKSANGMNMTLTVLSCAPRVFEIKNFLSDIEADHILNLSTNLEMKPSTTNSGPDLEGEEDTNVRSSTNAWVYRETSPIIDSIYRRAADVLQIDEALLRHRGAHERTELQTDHSIAEALQLVNYQVGQIYTAHHDFHYPNVTDRFQPMRFATILLYLNEEGMEGGDTVFPRAESAEYDGIRVVPEKGKAVLFYNMLPDGNVDDLSQHAGANVTKGEKWLANLWVWDPIIS